MHTFRELDVFRDARKSAALPRTYPLPHLRVLVKRPYFSLLFFLLFLRLPRHEWLAEEAEWKSKDFLLPPLPLLSPRVGEERSTVPTCLRYGTWWTSEALRFQPLSVAKPRLCKMEDVRLVVGRFFVAFKLVNWRRYCNSAAQLRSCLHSKLYSRKKWSRIK